MDTQPDPVTQAILPPPSPSQAKSGISALLCLVGVCLNGSLVCATFRTESLHHRCNFFIAIEAFFAALHLCALFVRLTGATVRVRRLSSISGLFSLGACLHLPLLPDFAAQMASDAQLCVSLDRLLSVFLPTWYSQKDKRRSFVTLLSACVAHSVYAGCEQYSRSGDWNPVGCPLSAFVPPQLGWQAGAIYAVQLCCYSAIWTQGLDAPKRRLMWALAAVSLFAFCCSVLGALVRLLATPQRPLDAAFAALCLDIAASSANAPILCGLSADYASAYRKRVCRLVGGEGRTNRVSAERVQNQSCAQPHHNGCGTPYVTVRQMVEMRHSGVYF